MPKPLDILFLGSASGNSRLRALAMERLGHRVFSLDPDGFLPQGRLARKLNFEIGGLLAAKTVERSVLAALPGTRFDAVWVDKGMNVGPGLVRTLRERHGPVANFNPDNAYTYRDRLAWSLFKRAIPEYDVLVFNRRSNVAPAMALGAKRTLVEFRTADEIAHAPRALTPEEKAKWTHDVVFVGTGMEDRPEFMRDLVRRGVPVTIYGNSWERGRAIPEIAAAWKGPGTKGPDEYAASILGAEVILGQLSKGNRDLHTRRSIEIPALGGLFCAERTPDHLALYEEGEEAVFWSSVEECADGCLRLLADEPLRTRIARQGHARAVRNGLYNEPFCQRVLDAALTGVVPETPGDVPV